MLYVLLCFSFLSLSCERKIMDQSSKVIVALPGAQNSLQNILNPLSIVSTHSDDENDEEFNSVIMPSFSSVSTFPINCYIVGIGTQNGDAAFTKNYCGKRSTINGKIDRNFEFGPYAGLFPSGTNIEIDVAPGDKRVIYVFGIHSLNPAACLGLSAEEGRNPNPNNFSRPFFVGKSALFTVASGQTSVVPINLINPGANDNIDACVIPSLNSEDDKVANQIDIERNSFPKAILIGSLFGDTLPTNYRCDYVDIVPKYLKSVSGEIKTARVDGAKQIQLMINGSINLSYSKKADCQGLVNPEFSFPVTPLDKTVRRWIGLVNTQNGTDNILRAYATDGSLQSANKTFLVSAARVPAGGQNLFNGSQFVRSAYDIVIPDNIVQGQCYTMFVTRKSLEDEEVVHGSIPSTFLLDVNFPAAVDFFNASGCSGGTLSPVPSIGTGQSFLPIWFRANGSFDLQIRSNTGFSSPVENSYKYKITATNSTNTTPESVDVSASEIIRQRGGPYNCNSIIFRFKNADKSVITNPLAGSIELLFAQREGDFADTYFYEDPGCSTTQIMPGAAIVSIPANSEFRKIYIKTTATSALGHKILRFKVSDGIKTYFPKIGFEVTAPNNPN